MGRGSEGENEERRETRERGGEGRREKVSG